MTQDAVKRKSTFFLRLSSAVRVTLIAIVTFWYSFSSMCVVIVTGKRKIYHPFARQWARVVLRLGGITIRSVRNEFPHAPGPKIYAANHSSMIDIPIVLSAIPDSINFIYKKELGRIPIFGWSLRISPYIGISRDRSREASRSVDEAAQKIHDGSSVLVFPEGTRTTTGDLLPFRRGTFSLAAKAKVPVVPVSIKGAFEALPRGSLFIRSGPIDVTIGAEVEFPETDNRDDERDRMNQVREAVNAGLSRGVEKG